MNGSHDANKDWLSTPTNVQSIVPADISILSLIRAGGQGAVFRGEVGGTSAAVKIYFPGQLATRIQREVNALASLQCVSIVNILKFCSVNFGSESLQLVATEFIEGQNLEDQIIQQGPLSENELGNLAYDVVLAINSMWQHRIVHRDLKPANIIRRPSGRFCVIDLGVARHTEMSSLTAMGFTWGTYGYFSPEQTKAIRQLTCKSDLYALGIVLVEAGLGRHPTNRDQLRLLAWRLHESLPAPLDSMSLSSIIQSVLDPKPTKRPKPEALLAQLSRYSSNPT